MRVTTTLGVAAGVCLFVFMEGCGGGRPPDVQHVVEASPVPASVTHLLLVRSEEWSATGATLTRYTREAAGPWRAEGEPVAVVLGRAGLGWGRGLHGSGAPSGHDGPLKAEGDGRSPAGVFAIGDTYGYDASPPEGSSAPYAMLTPTWQCVDDGASDRYNAVFDTAGMETPWTSHETMRREDELYRRVVFVEHNTAPAVAGGGSCIFLHVWRGPGSATSGCTAMELAPLEDVFRFIAPGRTVLVQLPEDELASLAPAWGLPR